MECATPCPANKICNPASGRCVLRTGVVGAKVLANRILANSDGNTNLLTQQAMPPRGQRIVLRDRAYDVHGLADMLHHDEHGSVTVHGRRNASRVPHIPNQSITAAERTAIYDLARATGWTSTARAEEEARASRAVPPELAAAAAAARANRNAMQARQRAAAPQQDEQMIPYVYRVLNNSEWWLKDFVDLFKRSTLVSSTFSVSSSQRQRLISLASTPQFAAFHEFGGSERGGVVNISRTRTTPTQDKIIVRFTAGFNNVISFAVAFVLTLDSTTVRLQNIIVGVGNARGELEHEFRILEPTSQAGGSISTFRWYMIAPGLGLYRSRESNGRWSRENSRAYRLLATVLERYHPYPDSGGW